MGTVQCKTCFEGYHLLETEGIRTCEVNECACPNGDGFRGTECREDGVDQGRRERFGNKYVFPLGRLALRAHEASLRGAILNTLNTEQNILLFSFSSSFLLFFPSLFLFFLFFLHDFTYLLEILAFKMYFGGGEIRKSGHNRHF